MGRENGRDDERPVHRVTVAPDWSFVEDQPSGRLMKKGSEPARGSRWFPIPEVETKDLLD
jgi:hypothetical protein